MTIFNTGTLVLAAVGMLSTGCSGNQSVTSPASSSTAGTPTTETFASFVAVGGASAHAFTVSQAGTINLTLTSVTPAAVLGVGIGVTGGTSAICSLSRSLDTAAAADSTPQLTIAVDAGTYCAAVYDAGYLTEAGALFSLTIDHP